MNIQSMMNVLSFQGRCLPAHPAGASMGIAGDWWIFTEHCPEPPINKAVFSIPEGINKYDEKEWRQAEY